MLAAAGVSALPPWLQLVIFALAGLFIAAGLAKKYFKEQVASVIIAHPPTPGSAALVVDNRDMHHLCEAIERLDATLRHASSDYNRVIDALQETTRASESIVRTMRAQGAMPPSEEMLILLRAIARDRGVFREDK